MRVFYFYTKKYPRAIAALPPDAELVYTGTTLTSYWEEIEKRWTGEDDIVFIEHDNVINERVIPEFSECPEPWCTFPYFCGPMVGDWSNYGALTPINLLKYGLGCTKISQRAQCLVTVEDVITVNSDPNNTCPDCGSGQGRLPICWGHIDAPIRVALKRAGFAVHVHSPAIDHLHYMPEERVGG